MCRAGWGTREVHAGQGGELERCRAGWGAREVQGGELERCMQGRVGS